MCVVSCAIRMAIDDTSEAETLVDPVVSSDGAESTRADARERRETTATVTDSYVVMTRRVIRPDPAADETAD